MLEIYARDLEASSRWYEAWGFKVASAEDDHFRVLTWDGAMIFLEQVDDLGPDVPRPAGNIRVMVPDVDAYWSKARELECSVLRPIDDRYYGLRDFTVAGPDGVGLRFASPLSL